MFSDAALTLFYKESTGLEVNNSEMAPGSLYDKEEARLVKGVGSEQAGLPSRSRPSQRHGSRLYRSLVLLQPTTQRWSECWGAVLSLVHRQTHAWHSGGLSQSPHANTGCFLGASVNEWLYPLRIS